MTDPDLMAGLRGVFDRSDGGDAEEADQTPPGAGRGLSRLVQRTGSETAPPRVAVAPTRPRPSTSTDETRVRDTNRPAPPVNDRQRLRRKTSLSLPPAIRRRLNDAYTINRWTFAELVDEGLNQLREGRIRLTDVERTLRANRSDEAAGTKTVALPVDVLEELDRSAAEWRLSRSQLVAALVSIVIDTL